MSDYIALLFEGTSVLNAETQEYTHARVGLHALAAKWCRLLQPLADQSRMSLILSGQALNWPLLFVDKRKVELALFHLLMNAIKYGHSGSDVLLEGVSEPGGFCLVVSNWGIAIPEEAQRIIFAGGYRSREAMAKSPIGQGLGLVIVNRVLQAHGGKVLLRRADGSPTQFALWFPERLANAPPTT
jgi:signal transduction histidine kinase